MRSVIATDTLKLAGLVHCRACPLPNFVKSCLIDAPVETVFGFHEREDALLLLSPPFPPLRVIRRTGNIDIGAQVELRIGPFKWVALHTAYEKNRLFVDEQIQGPFAKWVHRHEFEGVNGKTRLTDRVEFRLPGGARVNVALGWIVKLGLIQMFAHRHGVTQKICETNEMARSLGENL
jgi:ligand-binding SRPBCC domain-containing protein